MAIKLLGVRLDDLEKNALTERLWSFLQEGHHHIVTANAEMLVAAHRNSHLAQTINNASLVVVDGFGPLLLSRIFATQIHHRTTGSELIEHLANLAQDQKQSIFLMGGARDQAQRAATYLAKKYSLQTFYDGRRLTAPDQNGSWTMPHDLVTSINASGTAILLVALGHEKQELWIRDHLPLLTSVRVAVGVGGAFAFLSGDVRRAPCVMRTLGLEWLFRLILEPKKRFRRILTAVAVFPILVISDKIRNK